MVTPEETPQDADDAADRAAKEAAGETPDRGSTWADDRTTDLDPGRVGSDEQQSAATREEGEPDE